jgi:hypothetical protein
MKLPYTQHDMTYAKTYASVNGNQCGIGSTFSLYLEVQFILENVNTRKHNLNLLKRQREVH